MCHFKLTRAFLTCSSKFEIFFFCVSFQRCFFFKYIQWLDCGHLVLSQNFAIWLFFSLESWNLFTSSLFEIGFSRKLLVGLWPSCGHSESRNMGNQLRNRKVFFHTNLFLLFSGIVSSASSSYSKQQSVEPLSSDGNYLMTLRAVVASLCKAQLCLCKNSSSWNTENFFDTSFMSSFCVGSIDQAVSDFLRLLKNSA